MAGDPAGQLAGNHYYDSHFRLKGTKILPGEYYATRERAVLVTLLGSCVAACIRDPETGIGGMNHFVLPNRGGAGKEGASTQYGAFAMQALIGHLIKLGACRERLEAKVFGGGAVMEGLSDIGAKNAEFVLEYLANQHIPVLAQDLRGACPRRIYYFPHTGRVLVKRLQHLKDAALYESEAGALGAPPPGWAA